MAQRLLLAAVSTFLGSYQPGTAALVVTALCVLCAVANAALAPLRAPVAQHLQTVLLACLCVVALSGTPNAQAREAACASRSLPSEGVAGGMALLFGVVVPVVSVGCVYVRRVVLLAAAWRRSAARPRSTGTDARGSGGGAQ